MKNYNILSCGALLLITICIINAHAEPEPVAIPEPYAAPLGRFGRLLSFGPNHPNGFGPQNFHRFSIYPPSINSDFIRPRQK
ncbi:hypothetical protein CHUAL_000015 [Chamberlinius hualienensis]